MLNNRLGTQPLDPSVLLKFENSQAQKTQPLNPAKLPGLTQPQQLGDAFSKPAASNGNIPAQEGNISNALKPLSLAPLSAPITAPQLGGSTGGMTEQEATLLLDVSGKMGDMRHQNPVRFSEAVNALQNLNASADGSFAALNPAQQDLLKELGVTPENSKNILQKLYQIILPESGSASASYEKAQSSVSSFLSTLNVQQQAISFFENSEELKTVAGFLDGLSASSITGLIVDKVQQVNDFAVGTITGKSLKLKTPMDFTVGKVLVNAKEHPEQLEGISNIFNKVKTQGKLSREETLLLGQYGLFVDEGNKLKSIGDTNALSVDSVSQLEAMVESARTQKASPILDKVFSQSREVLLASDHYQELSERAREFTAKLIEETADLDNQKTMVSQGRQQTNILAAKLDGVTAQAQTMVDAKAVVQAIGSAPKMPPPASGFFGVQSANSPPSAVLDISTEDQKILSSSGIQVLQTETGTELYIGQQKISPEQAKAYLDQNIQNAQTTIATTQVELQNAQDKTNADAAELTTKEQSVKTLQQQTIDAQADANRAKLELTAKVEAYQQTYAEAKPHLSADEIALVDKVITPSLQRAVAESLFYGAETEVMTNAALEHSDQVIKEARAELEALAKDRKNWEASLIKSEDILQELFKSIQKGNQKESQRVQRSPEAVPESEPIRRSKNDPFKPARTGTAPLSPVWLQEGSAQLQHQQAQRREVQARNELSHFEHIQGEKRFNAEIQNTRREMTEKKAEQARIKEQAEAIQGS